MTQTQAKQFIYTELTDSRNHFKSIKYNNPKRAEEYKDIKDYISENYSWTNSILESIYCIRNDITEEPLCYCGTKLKWNEQYKKYCSRKCAYSSKEMQKRKVETRLMNNNGVYYTEEQIEKAKTTSLENYGVDNPMKADTVKNRLKKTKLEKYGDENYNNSKKNVETRRRNNGGVYVTAEEIKQREKTFMKNHGVPNINYLDINRYGTKKYLTPSGKEINYQGYENFLLDELYSIYEEEQVITKRMDMPEFWYYTDDEKKHRYFPDAYIKSSNTIYEVKSSYTLEQGKKNNIFFLKKQSVIDAGYNFELKVYDGKGKSINI